MIAVTGVIVTGTIRSAFVVMVVLVAAVVVVVMEIMVLVTAIVVVFGTVDDYVGVGNDTPWTR